MIWPTPHVGQSPCTMQDSSPRSKGKIGLFTRILYLCPQSTISSLLSLGIWEISRASPAATRNCLIIRTLNPRHATVLVHYRPETDTIRCKIYRGFGKFSHGDCSVCLAIFNNCFGSISFFLFFLTVVDCTMLVYTLPILPSWRKLGGLQNWCQHWINWMLGSISSSCN